MASNKQMGFTLIELVIVMLIVGILAAIAIPSYQDSVRETRRAEGKTLLLAGAQGQERHFTQFTQYATTISAAITDATNIQLKTTSDGGFYTLTLPNSTAATYTLRVTPQIADPDCGFLEFDQLGLGTSQTADPDCW